MECLTVKNYILIKGIQYNKGIDWEWSNSASKFPEYELQCDCW